MQLKKIKVVGFKSFADKVVLEFHEGVTGVVGPNGCGKSNIADAFRWVMGEQSAKSMRGGKMMDIIFAGTSKRKPLNMAEVSLTFLNNEGRIGIPYNEVEITRRYHRDGDSEYLINGNNVRLKDVQSILIEVGIGKNAYAIFEQGKIDQIIQLGPEERRSIFEEAAGILKFLMNKRDAERKLSEVELNCSRIKDIHDEVQKEIHHLTGQAQRAIEYKDLKNNLEVLEEESLSFRISEWKRKKTAQESTKQNLLQEKESQEAKCSKLIQDIESLKELLEKDEAHLKAKEKEVYHLKASLEVRQKELETLKERIQECVKKIARLNHEKEEILRLRKVRKDERVLQAKKQTQLSSTLEDQQAKVMKAQEDFQQLEAKVSKLRKEYEKSQEQMLTLTRDVNLISSDLKQKTFRQESLQEKIEKCDKETAKLALLLEERVKEEKTRRQVLDDASKEIDMTRTLFQNLDSEVKKMTLEIEEGEKHFDILTRDLVDLKAREKALLRLREDMEGASLGTKELLRESKKDKSLLQGKLKGIWEFFDIQQGFEQAVSAALRPYSDTLVAEDEETFQEALKFAEAKKLDDFSLVCLKNSSSKTKEHSLLKKVKINAVSEHFLSGKAVSENLSAALKFFNQEAGYEVFSLDGFYVDRCGVVFRKNTKGSSVFLRESELKTLSEKIKAIESEHQVYKATLATLKEKRAVHMEERQQLDKKARSLEMQLIEKNFQLQKSLSEIEQFKNSTLRFDEEKKSHLKDQKLLEEELVGLKEKHLAKEKALNEGSNLKEKLQKLLEEDLKIHKTLKDELIVHEKKFEQESDETRKILYALNLMDVKDQESLAQEKRCHDEIEILIQQQEVLLTREKELLTEVTSNKDIFGATTQDKELFEKALQEKKKGLKSHEKSLHEDEVILKKNSDKIQQVELQLVEILSKLETVNLQFREKYPEKEPREIDELSDKVDQNIKRIKEKLHGFTDINMTAVESLDNHQSRAKHLQKEMDDLSGSSEELLKIITQLEGESRELFRETFEAVRANFKKNFQILFNGGEADLELTQSDDLLKAGIEIVAKPPGKQMRSINLLSGGEKCLTAMALLFSIFEVKAAPFCILDEIDAPLDDTNVDRFCTMVKHFADRCQFILITHNKRTMSMADRLYGVSMEEKGVSKILKMEFQHQDSKQEVSLV